MSLSYNISHLQVEPMQNGSQNKELAPELLRLLSCVAF